MEKTLTRADICDAMINRLNLSRQEAMDLIELIISEIGDALLNHQELKISTFGTFHVLKKEERVGRNPKTGEEVMISQRKSISFKPAHNLRQRVNR